jgi:hypothetical protein
LLLRHTPSEVDCLLPNLYRYNNLMLMSCHNPQVCTLQKKTKKCIVFVDDEKFYTYVTDIRPKWAHEARNSVESVIKWKMLENARMKLVQIAFSWTCKMYLWMVLKKADSFISFPYRVDTRISIARFCCPICAIIFSI